MPSSPRDDLCTWGSAPPVVLAFGRRVDSDRKPMPAPEANADQIRYWNEAAGPKWVALHKVIDAQIAPLGERAMDRAGIAPGERVIDVGCGCGDTTIALGRRVGPAGLVLGVDISAPMLARAAETARAAGVANIRFETADAQTHRPRGSAHDAHARRRHPRAGRPLPDRRRGPRQQHPARGRSGAAADGRRRGARGDRALPHAGGGAPGLGRLDRDGARPVALNTSSRTTGSTAPPCTGCASCARP